MKATSGLFGEDKLELAQENNFCCRGCELSNENLLYRMWCMRSMT